MYLRAAILHEFTKVVRWRWPLVSKKGTPRRPDPWGKNLSRYSYLPPPRICLWANVDVCPSHMFAFVVETMIKRTDGWRKDPWRRDDDVVGCWAANTWEGGGSSQQTPKVAIWLLHYLWRFPDVPSIASVQTHLFHLYLSTSCRWSWKVSSDTCIGTCTPRRWWSLREQKIVSRAMV